jgi:hypothetical protein
LPTVVDVLKTIKPVRTTDESYVFLNQEGRPLNFHMGGLVFGIGS